jgi:rhamnosyl/mannosyltransferase
MGRADRIIAFTRRYVETSPVVSRYAEKCSFIPHGVDLAQYEASPRVAEQAAELRSKHGPRIVMFLGRLVYYKGIDVLLRSFVRVTDAKLLIIGDGPMRSSLEAQAKALGLHERVVFMGRLSHRDKVASLHASDLLVLPATHRSEAFGVVQVEAMACSRPVVSTNIDSGVPFVNQDGLTGLVVKPGDDGELAEAMVRLLGDKALRYRLGSAGRRRAQSLFSREVMLRDTLSLYSDLLEGLVHTAGNGEAGSAKRTRARP